MTSPRPTAAAIASALAAVLCAGCAIPNRPHAPSPTSAPASGPASAPTSAPASAPAAARAATPTPTPTPAVASPAGTVLATAAVGDFGTILVSSHGRTMYLADRDTSTSSTCYDACVGNWLPVTTTGAPVAAPGVDDGLIGTTVRSDGRTQILYNGHPLYYFAGDKAPGDTNGAEAEDFATTWHVVNDQGSKVQG